MKNLLNIYSIFDWDTFKYILIIAFFSWFPIQVFDTLVRVCSTSEIDKYKVYENIDESKEMLLQNLNI